MKMFHLPYHITGVRMLNALKYTGPEIAKRFLPDPVLAYLRGAQIAIKGLFSEDIPLNPKSEPVPFTQTATVQARFLIGTSSGLLYYDHGQLCRILDGFFYGITHYRDRWYAFNQHLEYHAGRIISFHLDGALVEDIRTEVAFLGPWVHQIHACAGHLYVTDTKNNRLSRYVIGDNGLKKERDFYASVWLRKNDVHPNSVYCFNGKIYLIYHNRTHYTGRKSQIAVLNDALQVEAIIDTRAGSAHNIALWKGVPMYCDSQAGTLVWNEPVLHVDCFTRGLALTDGLVLVGGSEFAIRENRKNNTGYVFALDLRDWSFVAQLTLPAIGSVLELRSIEATDYGVTRDVGGIAEQLPRDYPVRKETL